MTTKPTPPLTGGAAEVDRFLAELGHPRDAEVRAVRALILAVDPRIGEAVKWNAPSFHTTEHFATFHLRAKQGVQVILHLGAKPRDPGALREAVPDPEGLLRWLGPDRATVVFRDLADVAARGPAFAAVVRHWIEHLPPAGAAPGRRR